MTDWPRTIDTAIRAAVVFAACLGVVLAVEGFALNVWLIGGWLT